MPVMSHMGADDPRLTLWPAWARQLQAEYRSICAAYRLGPMQATLRIARTQDLLGQFIAAQRIIVISEALIWQQPWSSVIEVLKHEMAHQLAWAQAPHQQPHGPAFAAACRRLAVAAWATGAQVEMAWQEGSSLQPTSQVAPPPMLARLAKLWALAESDNPHEAALAAQNARRLCATLGGGNNRCDLDFVQVGRRRRRIGRIDAQLVALVTKHFAVDAVFVHTFDPVACTLFVAVEFLGASTALPLACHVYRYLWAQLERSWQAFGSRGLARGGTCRQAFMLGLLAGIDRKWVAAGGFSPAAMPVPVRADEVAAADRDPSSMAAPCAVGAMQAQHDRLKTLPAAAQQRRAQAAYVRARHPHLSSVGRRRAHLNAVAYAAGAADGAQVEVFRPIAGRAAATGRLPPAPVRQLGPGIGR